jgi:hypothetical protein
MPTSPDRHTGRENLYPLLGRRVFSAHDRCGSIDRVATDQHTVSTVAAVEGARTSGWAWRWTGWASWPVSPAVLWVCAAAVVVDVTTSWWGQPGWYLGRVSLSPALALAAVLVALIRPRRLGFSRESLTAWREFLLLGVPLLLVWCISYPDSVAAWRDVEGIVVAVAGEELVYRLAAVILIGAACARLAGRNWRDTSEWGSGPAIAGLVGGAVVFSLLPGHVAQMDGAANALPFLSLAVLLGYVAMRSGSIIPGFLVHLTIDLAALAFFAGELSGALRVLVDLGALVGVVLGLMLAGRRSGMRRRVPRVIDLREPTATASTS